jgi:hypothetical protein
MMAHSRFWRLFMLYCGITAASGSQPASRVLRALRKPPGTVAVSARLTPSEAAMSDAELVDASQRLRAAGVAIIVLRGDARSLSIVRDEQKGAASEFPGPCPVLYQPQPAPEDWRELRDCDTQALVLPCASLAVVQRGAVDSEAPAVPLVPRVTTAAELQAAAVSDAAFPCVLASASAWEEFMRQAASSDFTRAEQEISSEVGTSAALRSLVAMPGERVVLSELDLSAVGDAVARAREWCAAGCAGVLIDYDPAEWPQGPERLVQRLLSKKSASFGGLAMKHGVSLGASGISDQYWLNKNMKEAKRVIRRQQMAPGGGGVGE